MNIPTPAFDMMKHHLWGGHAAALGVTAGVALRIFAGGAADPRICGLVACSVVALGREAWNVTHGGRWSWADTVATMLGAVYPVGGFWIGGLP